MRKPEYLSPTSLKQFESSRKEFYLRYLADAKPPKSPQTKPMSVGSAFDAFCKSYLYFKLFGNYGKDDQYRQDKIFETQVESHNRDWARAAGERAFELYKKSGALADLMLELSTSIVEPRFEFSIQAYVSGTAGDVPLLGKPDIFFINDQGCRVLLDWKVNGWCKKGMTSPEKGYIMCRDSWSPSERRPSQRNRMPYKDCFPEDFRGIKINKRINMEQVNDEWAAQTTTYAWLLGEEIGSDELVVGIEQLCGVYVEGQEPLLRCASHRCRPSRDFQINLHDRYAHAWNCIESGILFPELGEEGSLAEQASLETMAESLAKQDPNSFEALVYQMARQ